ncbi:creatininase family protein [Streptacidiphilus jiangxiensis]|uniref:Creatinine amidohydrolase n=1 Tax=Streptacidiphilus jiangxiensis TaxID=235985 RepID=A0A1H8B482_STRJI|nr:creatininase family protein [Streptacidiphilus jiangxiensis]SEM76667.1 creatinine amidohydrolase [Streptacidiphilus jiangxiensis]
MNFPLPTATTTDERSRAAKVAVLPVGSFEQHGSHLPLSTDTLMACGISEALARAYGLLLLPPITIACSHEHAGWPGTVSIRSQTLTMVITDVAASLQESGVDQLVVVNGHGGNYVLANIVQEANTTGPRMALFPRREDWEHARAAAELVSTGHEDMHAGEIETSVLLYLWPELVRDSYPQADHVADRPHMLIHGLGAYTPTGVVGRPSLGTPEKGKAVVEALTAAFAETLQALQGGTSPEPARGEPGNS